jgi:RimJ/RimL family protein N-acetyltransferase
MSALRTLHQQISRLSAVRAKSGLHMPRPIEILPRPSLSTELMSFRPLLMGDRNIFLDALNRSREALNPWIPLASGGNTDEQYFESLVMKGAASDSNRTAWRRAGFLNDGQFLGMFNIIKIERGLSWSAEANWWVDSALSGNGHGSHAVQAMVDHALADVPIGLGLHQVRGHINNGNRASMRIAEKLGFVQTGLQDRLEVNGKLVEHETLVCNSIR